MEDSIQGALVDFIGSRDIADIIAENCVWLNLWERLRPVVLSNSGDYCIMRSADGVLHLERWIARSDYVVFFEFCREGDLKDDTDEFSPRTLITKWSQKFARKLTSEELAKALNFDVPTEVRIMHNYDSILEFAPK